MLAFLSASMLREPPSALARQAHQARWWALDPATLLQAPQCFPAHPRLPRVSCRRMSRHLHHRLGIVVAVLHSTSPCIALAMEFTCSYCVVALTMVL